MRSTGQLDFAVTTQGAVQHNLSGSTKLSVNKWYMVAATYDSNGYMKIYLDGKLDGTLGPFLNPINSISNLYIGSFNSTANFPFTGYISKVHFYNEALSLSMIQKIYADESPKYILAMDNER